jgi:putative endonuclease
LANQHLLGKQGESLAAKWLEEAGYTILHKNWRHAHVEVDIIANKNNVLHFIEVKTRSNTRFGQPEEGVDQHKIHHLLQAGEEFQYQYPQWKRVQYDVLSISIQANNNISYYFIDDIYL